MNMLKRYCTIWKTTSHSKHSLWYVKFVQDTLVTKIFIFVFKGLMLLGGKSDVSISSYLFKPIQRICKYPLLFRVCPIDFLIWESILFLLILGVTEVYSS